MSIVTWTYPCPILAWLSSYAYFKTQAGGRGYQTLINETLKASIRGRDLETILRRVIREELRSAVA